MTWFKVDDKLHGHPKAVQAGNAALGLWVRCGSWASDHLTEGFVPVAMVKAYGTVRQAELLVDAGLWIACPGGYQFHDWDIFQPTGDEVADLRRKRSDAGRKGAAVRWNRAPDDMANGMATPMANAMASDEQVLWQNDAPIPNPYSSTSLRTNHPYVLGQEKIDMDKIMKATGGDEQWAHKVANDVLALASTPVDNPTRYILRAVANNPDAHRPTNTPPRFKSRRKTGQPFGDGAA